MSSAQAVYPAATPPPEVLGEEPVEGSAPVAPPAVDNPTVLGDDPGGAGGSGFVPVADERVLPLADEPRGAAERRLPFTGFLAVPVLLAGALLILAGAALRGRSGRVPATG